MSCSLLWPYKNNTPPTSLFFFLFWMPLALATNIDLESCTPLKSQYLWYCLSWRLYVTLCSNMANRTYILQGQELFCDCLLWWQQILQFKIVNEFSWSSFDLIDSDSGLHLTELCGSNPTWLIYNSLLSVSIETVISCRHSLNLKLYFSLSPNLK